MGLYRLVYTSELSSDMDDTALDTLVGKARDRNAALGISGLLLHSGRAFMQVLEGEELRVASLYKHIAMDPRHHKVQTLLLKPAEDRMFADWGMQLASGNQSARMDPHEIEKTLLRLRLSSGDEMATETAALSLLQEFSLHLRNTVA